MQDDADLTNITNKINKCSLAEKTEKFYRFRLLEPEEDDDLSNEDDIINHFSLNEDRERMDVKQFTKVSQYYLQKLKSNNITQKDNDNILILFKKLRKKIIIYNYFLLFDPEHPSYEHDSPRYKKDIAKASRYFKNIKISLFTALKNWNGISKNAKKNVLKDAINLFSSIREMLLEIYEDETIYEEEKFDIFIDNIKNL